MLWLWVVNLPKLMPNHHIPSSYRRNEQKQKPKNFQWQCDSNEIFYRQQLESFPSALPLLIPASWNQCTNKRLINDSSGCKYRVGSCPLKIFRQYSISLPLICISYKLMGRFVCVTHVVVRSKTCTHQEIEKQLHGLQYTSVACKTFPAALTHLAHHLNQSFVTDVRHNIWNSIFF